MKTLFLLNVLISILNYANSQLLLTENMNSNVTLNVYPPYIVEGLAFSVDIECRFKRDTVPSMASVLSMQIAYSNETIQPLFNKLASVNELEDHAQNDSYTVEVVSGSIDNNGESKLHMRFKYPENHLIGLYMCEVTGFDQIGKPVSVLSTINVSTSKITDLFDLIHKAESNLNARQACIDSQAAFIESMMHKVYPALVTNYNTSIFYNGHDYYLSHGLYYFNYTEMQSSCDVFGGYLVELDTHDEFSFIRDYLNKLGVYGFIMTGATDEKQEGIWINEHNSTSTPSFDWFPGQPYTDRLTNCQVFEAIYNWLLSDWPCYYNFTSPIYFYICEVPRTMCQPSIGPLTF